MLNLVSIVFDRVWVVAVVVVVVLMLDNVDGGAVVVEFGMLVPMVLVASIHYYHNDQWILVDWPNDDVHHHDTFQVIYLHCVSMY